MLVMADQVTNTVIFNSLGKAAFHTTPSLAFPLAFSLAPNCASTDCPSETSPNDKKNGVDIQTRLKNS